MEVGKTMNWESDTAVAALAGLLLTALSFAGPGALRGSCEVPAEWRLTRPDPESTPTKVRIGLFLIDLNAINDAEQSFEADIFLSATWQDTRLVSGLEVPSVAGCKLALGEVWSPRILFVNERDVRRRFDEAVSVEADGTVMYLQRLQGEFTTGLQLRDFPFDSHELSLDIVSRAYFPEEIEFVPDAAGGRLGELTITDWDIGQGIAVVEPRYIEPRDWYLAGISFRWPAERRVGFYLMKTFLPLTLIVCMSWAVFWIQPGLLPPQIGVATSAVLTLIAFQFSLGYILPRLSYLTRADRFLIGSTLLVFLAFGEALWTSYLATHDREPRAVRIDRVSRILFPTGFLLVILLSFAI